MGEARADAVLCALYVREGERCRIADGRQDVPLSARYDTAMRQALISGVPKLSAQGLTVTSSPLDFHHHVAGINGHVVGLAVQRPHVESRGSDLLDAGPADAPKILELD